MHSLKEMLQSLTPMTETGETLYSINEFSQLLKKQRGNKIKVDNYLLTPFYVYHDQILELYAFELNIEIVSKPNFENYLLRVTGQRRLEDVPEDLFELHHNTYVETSDEDNLLEIDTLLSYITYLYNSDAVRDYIEGSCHASFEKDLLYFAYYY